MHTTCTFRRQEAWRTSISRLRLFLKKTVPKKRKKRWGSSWNTTLTKKCSIIRSWEMKRLKLRPYCRYRKNRVKTYCQRKLSGPKLRLIALITALTLFVKNKVINPRRRPSKIQAHRHTKKIYWSKKKNHRFKVLKTCMINYNIDPSLLIQFFVSFIWQAK